MLIFKLILLFSSQFNYLILTQINFSLTKTNPPKSNIMIFVGFVVEVSLTVSNVQSLLNIIDITV